MTKSTDKGGTLYLSGGGKSWPVMHWIESEGRVLGGTTVSVTIEFFPGPGGRTGPILQEIQEAANNPNEFFVLKTIDGRWAQLILRTMTASGALMTGDLIDPPPWAAA